jgi:pimeloyl-ACP methyl ester carboxylesterase
MQAMITELLSRTREVTLSADGVGLTGNLTVPEDPVGLVLFAHGSGSSRHSPRNRFVAGVLNEGGLATLLIDLLSAEEEAVDLQTRALRFDIPLLAGRVVAMVDRLADEEPVCELPVGLFGSSTGAAAALIAAARRPRRVGAVVSRGGRADLAGDALDQVRAPTLLIVGGLDQVVLALNEQALERLPGERRLEIVPGATHLFEEPGALPRVAALARDWFAAHLGAA